MGRRTTATVAPDVGWADGAVDMRVARAVIGVAVASLLVLAWASSAFAKPAASAVHHAARHGAAKKSRAAKKTAHDAKPGPPSAAALAAYAAMPEAERLAIQSDLALLGDYEVGSGGYSDEHVIEAVEAFQKRHGEKETGILTSQERDVLAAAARSSATAIGWQLIEDPVTGARVRLPRKLVPQSSVSLTGSRWSSAQGQIRIETFRLAEAALPALFEDEKKAAQRRVETSAHKGDSFIISGVQGLKNFVVRVAANGSELRGITVLYDQATQGIMASVALAVANAFVGFPDPHAAPPPGMRRMVDYGTAIVVTPAGDLLAPAQLTNECQTIAVPSLGHAERVAEDKNNDLALLRVYGVRNLVPVVLGGAGESPGEVTLVGIADPLAQAGDGATTRLAARLGAAAIDPAPPPGFAGAAAIDAQGRLAGMVALKSGAAAGANSVGRPAIIVPAAAIRSFLQANGVGSTASTAADPAIAQSVVRVICVRK